MTVWRFLATKPIILAGYPASAINFARKMIEEWVMEKGLHHLNQQPNCRGLYTFGKSDKAKSSIDHTLVNDNMESKFTAKGYYEVDIYYTSTVIQF